MRRNAIFDKVILGITSILLAVGVAYIWMNDDRNTIGNQIVETWDNPTNKIITSNKIRELTKELRKLEQHNEREYELRIDVTDSCEGLTFHISNITNSEDSQDDINRLINKDEFKTLEKYTGKNLAEDITTFLNEEDTNNTISKVYSDCNTTVNMDKDPKAERGYLADINIVVYDYEIEDSHYQDIDKMIRGDGYSLLEINQTNGSSEMRYQDIGVVTVRPEVYIVDNVKINGSTVELRIVTKNNEIIEVSLLGNSRARSKEEIIITEYQSEMISRLVAALGIPQAEEKIKELLFDSENTHTEPKITAGDGYEIKSSYVVRGHDGDRKYYCSRLDIRVK